MIENHEKFMAIAVKEAELALKEDELPVGAVIVVNNKIWGKGHRSNNL